MRCRDCPYGAEYFEKSYSQEDINEEYVWCDKVGGKTLYFGHCTDWYKDNKSAKIHNHNKKKRRSKRERDKKYKQHLVFLAEEINSYPPPAYYKSHSYAEREYIENPKPYYKRIYRENHPGGDSKYYKKYCNRHIRRYKGEIHKGGFYKKIAEFWWNII